MKVVKIKGDLRKSIGKKDSNKLRAEEKVPCVMYGSEENIHFSVGEKALKKIVFTPNVYLVDVEIDGKEMQTIVQELQFHPVSDKVIHVDFLQVFKGKPVTVAVPIKIVGSSPGVQAGGNMQATTRKLTIKALPKHLPDTLDIDVSKLELGKSIKVGELDFDNIELLDSKNAVVVSVKLTRVAKGMEEKEGEGDEEEGEEGAEGADGEKTEVKEEAKE